MGAILAAGEPDENGNVIPPGVDFGGYRVQKVGPRLGKPINVEALVFNHQTKSFLALYNTCCVIFNVSFNPTLIAGPPGGGGQMLIEGVDCSSQLVNLTTSGDFFSGSTGIATVGLHTGGVSLISPGSTDVDASLEYWSFGFFVDPCLLTLAAAATIINVDEPPKVSISSNTDKVPLRGPNSFGPRSIQMDAVVSPAGGTIKWSTTSTKVSLSNWDTLRVTVTAEAKSDSRGDVPITAKYTLSSGDSATATINLTVQKPSSLGFAGDISSVRANCPTGECGWERKIYWQARDQFTDPIQFALEIWDSAVIDQGDNSCNLLGVETTCSAQGQPNSGPCNIFTFPDGRFDDTLSMCAAACLINGQCTGTCQSKTDFTWHVNGFTLSNDIKSQLSKCNSVTVNGQ